MLSRCPHLQKTKFDFHVISYYEIVVIFFLRPHHTDCRILVP